MKDMKKIRGVHYAPRNHWVGDGFDVSSMFSYDGLGREISPFLLLDYAAPKTFAPSERPHGVGWHPHRGFETVTIALEGEIEHHDSTGNAGVIGRGDVQWMTAASGILHEEFHSREFARRGGTLEMAQLWVNLPAQQKTVAPGYQAVKNGDIPAADLPDDAGTVHIIAGEYNGHRGPAHTFTPMDVWDVRLKEGRSAKLALPEGRTAALAVLRGTLHVNERVVHGPGLVVFEPEGTDISLSAGNDVLLLVLSGEPIDEPIVGYGPFVMNTDAEIDQAIADFNNGRFGEIPQEAFTK